MAIFREYIREEGKSDRSGGDRARHRRKIREAIKEHIADIISEESIIGQSRDKIIRIPIRGIKEYRFVYGDNNPGVAEGSGDLKRGDIVEQGQQDGGNGKAGNAPGADIYETDITLAELIDIMFEDLELPFMERKKMLDVLSERKLKFKGYRRKGIRPRLDKKKTALRRIKRKIASKFEESEDTRFPFHMDDLTFHHTVEELHKQANAVVICIMDTSGSMDTIKKYLARSFYFLLYQFVKAKYDQVEMVYIAHHTDAREVTEDEFFHKGESGGTCISSGYKKALEIIEQRYHPTVWNVYAFHCSDGDNFDSDNQAALHAAKELTETCNLFGYGEIKPVKSYYYGDSMIEFFKQIQADNFTTVKIEKKEDLWQSFRDFLSKERVKE